MILPLTVPRPLILAGLLLALACTGLGGCQGREAERPALVSHIVFVKLVDPADRAELIADSDELLAPIYGVSAYACGEHVDTGRPTVLADYDVGLYIGFESLDDYSRYVDDPNHVEFVTRWRPRLEWIKVYDVMDETP